MEARLAFHHVEGSKQPALPSSAFLDLFLPLQTPGSYEAPFCGIFKRLLRSPPFCQRTCLGFPHFYHQVVPVGYLKVLTFSMA